MDTQTLGLWWIYGPYVREKYGLGHYLRDLVNTQEFSTARQWKQIVNKLVQVCNNQENAQSEGNPHSKNQVRIRVTQLLI